MRNRVLAALLALQLCGCGTLLYPERQGLSQGQGARVDPAIVMMDGALLLLFIVPGLVAYGIDFYTGAIYVPSGDRDVSMVFEEPEAITAARVRSVVQEHTGFDLRLDDPRLEIRSLPIGTDLEEVLREIQERGFDEPWWRADARRARSA